MERVRKCMFFLFFFNSVFLICAKRMKITCPSYCTCDIYTNVRRARCVNRTIVVADLDLPIQTQMLDVSYNQISQLKENVFRSNKLVHLQLLNMSHNRLADVNIFAFEGLIRLKVLNLSYNAIQQVFPQWFVAMTNLEYLFLRGNHFRDMSSLVKNAFNSEKLKVLDLSDSHIIHIKGDIFNLPHLIHLDLSGNQLISLNQDVISPLRNLKVFKVNDNLLTCDKEMRMLKKIINLRNILYHGDPCKKIRNKFEKLVLQDTRILYNEKNYWVIDDNDGALENKPVHQIPCQKVREVNYMIQLPDVPYILLVSTALVFGILIGLLCGCSIKSCRIRYEFSKATGAVRARKIRFLQNEAHLPLQESPLGYSTPILERK